jgi:spore germination protein YaaH
MKYPLAIVILSVFLLTQCKTQPKEIQSELSDQEIKEFVHHTGEALPVTTFKEVWGYVMTGHESDLTKNIPLTDVGYFGMEVDIYGSLTKVPNRQNLSGFGGRVHLVAVCNGNALSYFTLMPESPQRKNLIADLISATKNYDGLNIDFENIPPRSSEAYISFLRELRAGLPKEKIFSVALAARTKTLTNDVYDYEKIKPIVDKIFVMAYDEHWSGGPPGSVASLRWCRSVADYSMRVIGGEKLVMGIPFYGRAWEEQNHHRALIYATTEKLIDTYKVKDIKRENGIPTFNYIPNVNVKVYYEDEYSISARMEMYKAMKINAVGFWRIGQETPKVWDIIKIEK